MTWIVFSRGDEYGCCKWFRHSWKAVCALLREGFEVWEIDMEGFNKNKDSVSINTLNLETLERTAILQALKIERGSQDRAAILCGISPRALHYKIHTTHEIPYSRSAKSWRIANGKGNGKHE